MAERAQRKIRRTTWESALRGKVRVAALEAVSDGRSQLHRICSHVARSLRHEEDNGFRGEKIVTETATALQYWKRQGRIVCAGGFWRMKEAERG